MGALPVSQNGGRRSLGLGAGGAQQSPAVTHRQIPMGGLMTRDFLFARMGEDGVPGQTRRVRRGRGRCLDRQGSAQRPGPHKGGPGGQCGWKDQASHSATHRPSRSPRMGRARRVAWEPESAPRVHHDSQPSSTLEGQVLHHLVQEEHLGPTVAELEGEGLRPGDRLGWASQTGVPFKAVRALLSL